MIICPISKSIPTCTNVGGSLSWIIHKGSGRPCWRNGRTKLAKRINYLCVHNSVRFTTYYTHTNSLSPIRIHTLENLGEALQRLGAIVSMSSAIHVRCNYNVSVFVRLIAAQYWRSSDDAQTRSVFCVVLFNPAPQNMFSVLPHKDCRQLSVDIWIPPEKLQPHAQVFDMRNMKFISETERAYTSDRTTSVSLRRFMRNIHTIVFSRFVDNVCLYSRVRA